MMSPRKRIRPNPKDASSSSLAPSQSSDAPKPSSEASRDDNNTTNNNSNGSTLAPQTGTKTRSWYGSWPRVPKSTPSTQVARETILGGTLQPISSADFSRFDTRKIGDDPAVPGPSPSPPDNQDATINTEHTVDPKPSPVVVPVDSTIEDGPLPEPQGHVAEADKAVPTAGWLGWFNKSAPTPVQTAQPEPTPMDIDETPNPAEPAQPGESAEPGKSPEPPQDEGTLPTVPETDTTGKGSSVASWFPFWSNASSEEARTETVEPPPAAVEVPRDVDAPAPAPAPAPALPPEPASVGSTWAFWSRDGGTKAKGTASNIQEQGELAVIGEGSEDHPKPAGGVEVRDTTTGPPSAKEAQTKDSNVKESPSKRSKRLRPQSMDLDVPGTPTEPSSRTESPKPISPAKGQTSAKPLPPNNLLLPPFRSTYRLKENPSILRQIGQLLLRTQQPPANHVFLAKDLPKIKRAVAIGVHGLFPAAYLRPMMGQPTGTSLKFASHCADALRKWADSHGCEDCEIEKVALEGEGRIADRVENLWKLLLNWIDHLRNADVIVLACHSQGVPVGIMLIAKLIELGIVTTPRIGICAMAGVSLGPFPDYKSGLGMLMGSASELWEFANPNSEVSKRYEQALKVVLDYGARITFVGSIDDQVVPMESAIFSPAQHPYIFRAVFIDGRIHAPDFIAHLVGFACKLRNLGISDHGLIRELSVPLAGSLYSGSGHSALHDELEIYDLAVTHTLETSDVGRVPCQVQKYSGLSNPNPYHLPWIMRGLLEEDFVKTELDSETTELLKQFDEWKPITKALKDVKYRLEAVRSKI